jgi:hypothetical protein
VINEVSLPDPGVPLGDQGLVHFSHRRKWAPAKINDVSMVEMSVSRKINISHSVILLREPKGVS